MGTKNFSALREAMLAKMTAEQREQFEAESSRRLEEYRQQQAGLVDLRKARNLTQVKLAESLGVAQSEVSRLEQRTDMYVSTLRDVVEAMGGELEIRAKFPGSPAVTIGQFSKDRDAA